MVVKHKFKQLRVKPEDHHKLKTFKKETGIPVIHLISKAVSLLVPTAPPVLTLRERKK